MPPRLRWVLLLAFVLRSATFVAAYVSLRDPQAFYAKDTWSYLQPAIELFTHSSYTMHGEPELFRTPGYAVLLGVGIQLGQIEFITIGLQILLSCATTYLVFRIAKEVFEEVRAALASAFLYSLEPLSLIACSWLLSETLFGFVLAAALFLAITFAKYRHRAAFLGAVMLLAAAAYVRPIAYWLPLCLTLVFLLWSIVKREWQLIKPAILLAIIAFALLGAWQWRNFRQTGYAGFSVAMSYNLYFHQVASLRAHEQQRPFYEVLEELGFYDRAQYLRTHPEQQSWALGERYEFMQREGFKAVAHAPWLALKIYLRGMAIALFDPGATEYLRLFQAYPRSGRLMNTMVQQGIGALLKTIVTEQPLLFLLSAIFGLWLMVNYALAWLGLKGQSLTLPLLLLLITGLYQLALSGGTLAAGRFRMPVMLVVCILAGQGLAKAGRRFHWQRARN